MSNQEQGDSNREAELAKTVRAINGRLDIIEGQQRKDEENERRHNLSQLRVNRTIAVFTGLLFLTSAVSNVFLLYQIGIGKQSADAATVAADAAKGSATTAASALSVGNRPWVKISHRIVRPLTFGSVGADGPIATMTVEDTLENVGQTVALNVLYWEDVMPMDADGHGSAIARQREWCDANRNSQQTRTIGSVLFPHIPAIQYLRIGPLMSKVNQALAVSPIPGKVGFVMVGCVVYRSSFEPSDRPNHQTRFVYDLGIPQSGGGYLPYIIPRGAASTLRFITTPWTFTAD
jgi:hypothetical protein